MSRRFSHPIFSRVYLRVSETMDQKGGVEHRRRLLAGLAGSVVEVGAGNGRNFAHYPSTVTAVTAVEPEPRLRAAAELAAQDAQVPVTVVDGFADELSFDDSTFDAGAGAVFRAGSIEGASGIVSGHPTRWPAKKSPRIVRS